MSDLYELRCRECGKTWGNVPKSFCEDCFSPLEVSYDYDSLKKKVRRENLAGRTFNMWRYAELLPLPEDFTPASAVGGTPLVASRKLASHWGIGELYFKNDAVCFPSLSFKDRVVGTALVAARRFGFQTVGCSSTGNLANAVAAQSAQQGFDACVFIPADLEPAKVLNTAVYGARIVRINGNYDHVVVPMAGGSLITKIAKAFKELVTLGWVEAKPVKFFGAQATGCSPISDGVKRNLARFEPQKPNTIARSLAIGNPADGPFAIKLMRESGGWAEDISDPEIVAAIKLLAETEGIFTETAGGVTAGVTQKLIQQGRIRADETTVVCITGNGLKTLDAISAEFPVAEAIAPRLDAFEAYLDNQFNTAPAAAVAK
jgi:threonine synthase